MKQIDDSIFPGISTALNINAVRDLVSSKFKKEAPDLKLVKGRIWDVKYEHDKQCVILYRFKFENIQTHRSYRQDFMGKLVRTDEPFPQPVNYDDQLHFIQQQDLPIQIPMFFLDDPRMAFYTFPCDPVMPWLKDLFDPLKLKKIFNRSWPDQGSRVKKIKVHLLDYAPQMRASFLYEVLTENKETKDKQWQQLIGKTNHFKKPARSFATAWTLWSAAHQKVGLARPVSYFSNPKLTLQEKIEGERLGGMVGVPYFEEIVRKTAQGIATIHNLSLPLTSTRKLKNEIVSLERRTDELMKICPDLKKRIFVLREKIKSEMERRLQVKGPVHGDFHHSNIFVNGKDVSFIDLEEMAYGDPCLDVGRFMASLRVPSLRVFGNITGLDQKRASFLEEYLRSTDLDVGNIHLFEAAALFTPAIATFRIQRPEWKKEVSLLVDEAYRIFEKSTPKKTVSMALPLSAGTKNPEVPFDDRLKFGQDEQFMKAMLDKPVKDIYGVDILSCQVRHLKAKKTCAEICYTVIGLKNDKKIRRTVKGIMFHQWVGAKIFDHFTLLRDVYRGSKNTVKLPEPVAFLPSMSMMIVKASRSKAPVLPQKASRDDAAEAIPELSMNNRPLRDLAKTVAKRCRKKTVLFRRPDLPIKDYLHEYVSDITDAKEDQIESYTGQRYGSVVLAEVLDAFDKNKISSRIQAFFNLVEKGGRLIVIVPNEESGPDVLKKYQFNKKSLRAILKPLGNVTLVKNQPYKWLMMVVDKPKDQMPKVGASKRNRLAVTSKLCSGKVIEFGCGIGLLSSMVCERGCEVIGVDINTKKIETARRNYTNIEFINSDVRDLNFEEGSFDTVILPEIIEHVPDRVGAQMLELGWKLLKPHGRLIVSVPNEDCIPHPNHVRQFDKRSLMEILEKFGKPELVADQPYKWLMGYVEKT